MLLISLQSPFLVVSDKVTCSLYAAVGIPVPISHRSFSLTGPQVHCLWRRCWVFYVYLKLLASRHAKIFVL